MPYELSSEELELSPEQLDEAHGGVGDELLTLSGVGAPAPGPYRTQIKTYICPSEG